MREVELLTVLAKAKPGIEIRMCEGQMVTVRMHGPKVCGVGRTLMAAAIDCVHWLIDVANDHPEIRTQYPEVFQGITAYDERSRLLQDLG